MCGNKGYYFCMSKMIQLRNVRQLASQAEKRAESAGMTLSDFLIREAELIAARPTMEEMRKRLEARPIRELNVSPTKIIREERDRL